MHSFLSFLRTGILATAVVAASSYGGIKTGEHLQTALNSGSSDFIVWVYLADKGVHELKKGAVPTDVVSELSLRRRAKVRPGGNLVDYTDLPLDPGYVRQIAALVQEVRHQSRWFNSMSVIASKEQIASLEALPFVKGIELVERFRRGTSPEGYTDDPVDVASQVLSKNNSAQALDYGPSSGQMNQINVPAVHALGNSAQGVIIGVLDNGFRLLTHEAFDTLRARIIATRDFVDHKVSVVPVNPAQGSHGIFTLSAIGGYKPGQLIGPAFGARYILARTENDSSETPVEEDNWAAAIEWAESLGVEVTSTSLGYFSYDSPYNSWTWQNMDGRTTVITRASVMAVSKGVVVVNSAGNEGTNRGSLPNSLNAPADGDGVIAVGAVSSGGTRASFSSFGPTADRRIKPDVMAQGVSVACASASATNLYETANGTSLSCPLVAGVAALLVKAYPHATPAQILSALKMTASRASTPDNFYGWGIVDALAAVNYLKSADTGSTEPFPVSYTLEQNYPNPFNPNTTIQYRLPEGAAVSLQVFDILGRRVKTLVSGELPANLHTAQWDGTDDLGFTVSSGVYFYRLDATGVSGRTTTITKRMMLVK